MKRPTWATIIGVMGILFSCFGIFNGSFEILTPKLVEFQKGFFSAFLNGLDQQENTSTSETKPLEQDKPTPPFMRHNSHQDEENLKEMAGVFHQVLDFPPWFSKATIVLGTLKILISVLYLLASIGLLQVRPYAISLFYGSSGGSLLLNLAKIFIGIASSSLLGLTQIPYGIFGAVIDLVLLLIVLTRKKEPFFSEIPSFQNLVR